MHALLGLAATHLRRYSPNGVSYRMAESYHCHSAIQLYKKELACPIGLHNMDALISTCLVLGTLFFSADKYKPTDSWVFSSDPTALNWVLVQCGFTGILNNALLYL